MNIALLPIRSGSKRLENKNFIPILGVPLFGITLAKLVSLGEFDQIILALDNTEQIPFDVIDDDRVTIYIRSEESSSDTASTEFIMLEVCRRFNLSSNDNLFIFQATNPFLRLVYVSNAISWMHDLEIDSVVTAIPSKRFTIEEVLHEDFKRERTQDKNPVNLETGLFWTVKVSSLLDKKCRIGWKPKILPINEHDDFDIDTHRDLEFALPMIKRHIQDLDVNLKTILKKWFHDFKALDFEA